MNNDSVFTKVFLSAFAVFVILYGAYLCIFESPHALLSSNYVSAFITCAVLFIADKLYDLYRKRLVTKETLAMTSRLSGKWESHEGYFVIEEMMDNYWSITHNLTKHKGQPVISRIFFDKYYKGDCYCGDVNLFHISEYSTHEICVTLKYTFRNESFVLYRVP